MIIYIRISTQLAKSAPWLTEVISKIKDLSWNLKMTM